MSRVLLQISIASVVAVSLCVGRVSHSWAADGAAPSTAALPAKTALDDYVAKPDASYQWKLAKTVQGPGVVNYVLDMTSQTWRSKDEVSQPEWKHWVVIAKPDEVKYDTALLVVAGGGSGSQPEPSKLASQMAMATKSVVIELKQIPNQPLVFFNDGEERKEDNTVAYSWDKVMTTGDPTWCVRFPMVKAAVRAMDSVQAFLASKEGGELKINKFVVCGASKRGWTTWLVGAVDPRVVAIMPLVIDALNLETQLRHHYASYGFWAPSVRDYVRHKIVDRIGAPEGQKLYPVEDPYFYRHRLTMPKYIITATGDQFFPSDAARYYFDDLVGEKYLRTLPNTDHSGDKTDMLQTVVGFYEMILNNTPRPRLSWKFSSEGAVRIECQDRPTQVSLWKATNPDARDFRLESFGPHFEETKLEGKDGVYEVQVEKPAQGWTAWFVELRYPSGGKSYLKVTTPVRVIPDTLPFGDKIIPGTNNVKAGL